MRRLRLSGVLRDADHIAPVHPVSDATHVVAGFQLSTEGNRGNTSLRLPTSALWLVGDIMEAKGRQAVRRP
jgi:hypothetical protein